MVDWVAVEPRGSVYSYTIVGRPTAKGFSHTPYGVVIVSLDEPANVRIIGSVVDIEPSRLAIGLALEGRFTTAGPNGEMVLLQWAPTGSKA